jgi:hypothetical protein
MAAPFKRTRWKPSDVFALPLVDGSFGVVQAIAPVEAWAVDLALFSDRFLEVPFCVPPLNRANVVSIQATWRTTLNGGWWAKVGSTPLVVEPGECPNQKLLAAGGKGVGCTHSSEGLLQDFLSAYHGLIPWNLYPAHNFDVRLFPGVKRPKAARLLDDAALLLYQRAAQCERYDV